MSVHVIYFQGGAKKMRPVTTLDEYLALRGSERQKSLVAQCRRGDKKAKSRLLQMNYSCLPCKDGRLKGSKTASATVGMDIDFDPKAPDYEERMAQVPELVLAKKEVLGLLLLERSASKGYHIVFKRKWLGGLAEGKVLDNQEQNLRWASMVLGVQYDEGAKDITRVFFTTTDSEEDLLFVSEEIFDNAECEVRNSQPSRGARVEPNSFGSTEPKEGLGRSPKLEKSCVDSGLPQPSLSRHCGQDPQSNETGSPDSLDCGSESAMTAASESAMTVASEVSSYGTADSQPPVADAGSQSAETQHISNSAFRTPNSALDYAGLPYDTIVHHLENQLGGVPAHGSRNNFIFAMACHLRYVCNDDPEWIARVLPNYGEDEERWMNTIRSACNRSQNKTVPRILATAIDLARTDQIALDDEEKEGTDGSGNGTTPPPMPTKLPPLVELLVSKTPAIYKPAVAHAIFPALASHLWKTRFRYIDNVEHEATLMNVLMAGTGAGKNCIAEPIRRIMRDIVDRDQINREKERLWKEEMQTKGSNKDKKKRPEGLVIQNVKPDMTNAAFVQRMKEAEGHFLYTQMNEIDQFDALKTSARSQSQFQIMCLAFDPQNSYGTERVGTASVSETVCVRFNWNASTTINKGRSYFARVLTDGPISRINFCTIPERPIGSEMPIYGAYDDTFDSELKPYIDRLNAARGLVECDKAVLLAKKLMEENADFARLSQSRVYENLSFRANVIAFLKAMVLYVAQGEKWDTTLEEFIRWSERYDLWCKMKFFGDAIEDADAATASSRRRPGPQNLLSLLPDEFSSDELQQVRRRQGVDKSSLSNIINMWKTRGYIFSVEGKENIWKKNNNISFS